MLRFAVLMVAFALLASYAYAQELRYDIYEFKLKYGSVFVINDKIFAEPTNISTALPIPINARAILTTINSEPVELQTIEDIHQKFLIVNKTSIEHIRVSYITELTPPNEFLITLASLYPTKTLQASLALGPEAVLDIPFVHDRGSIYPKPDTIDKDSRLQIYIWERVNLKQGDELSLYVKFQQRASLFLTAVPIALFLVILGFYLYYLRSSRSRGNHGA